MYRMLMTWHDDDGEFRAAIISYDDAHWSPFDDLAKCEPAITDMHGDGMFGIASRAGLDSVGL